MRNSSADNTQTESEITTTIPFVEICVQRENNLQTEEISLTQQKPYVAANNAPSKRSLTQRARREKERQIVMMHATINNTYNNTNVGINDENSFTVATSKCALVQRAIREREKRNKIATFYLQTINNIHHDVYLNGDTSTQQYSRCYEARNEAIAPHASPMNDVNNHWNTLENAREKSDNCGFTPSKILSIDETTNTATKLRNHINEPPQEPFMDEYFFNDDNMDLEFEFNIDPLVHETRHYFGNMDIKCPSCHTLHLLDEKLRNSSRYRPLFGTCRKQGKIRLPILQPLPPAMQELYDDDSSHAKSFRSQIRKYNAANAFTSLGVKLDNRIQNGRGPKQFSIYGELKHRVGDLLSIWENKQLMHNFTFMILHQYLIHVYPATHN
ncbi:hypothetical protein GIB67_010781 [Kingdonia uniflora]|uniref:Helitron helicase-like domain-containing protein n=1 Tax=Kingdonia uniflora TaxID=39325 RepID=A0A7J7L8T1_9MAGN|nr:hypothetical protein GIB67_010781 [Kingdonia uniflora]